MLVAAPAGMVEHWASNWEFWAGPGANVVPYVGTSAARALIYDHELWLAPESLDTKTSAWMRQGVPARVRRPMLRILLLWPATAVAPRTCPSPAPAADNQLGDASPSLKERCV